MHRLFTIKKGLLLLVAIIAVGGYILLQPKPLKTRYITQPVQQGTLIDSVSGTGNLFYSNTANVSSQQSGIISKIDVQTGQSVSAGQTLYSISNPALQTLVSKSYATYTQAKQSVAAANATVTQDQNNIATLESDSNTTAAQLNLANQQLYAASLNVTVAQANQSSAWQDYQNQVQNNHETTISSPITGVVTVMNVAVGNQVNVGGGATNTASGTVTIVDPTSLEATISLNEVDAVKVTVGQAVNLTFNAINGLNLTGSVQNIDTNGTTTQGVVNYNVTVSLSSLNPQLKGAMSTSAAIVVQAKQNVTYVPNSAIKASSNGSNYVQVLKNGKPVEDSITTGLITDADSEIISGLKPGQLVITQIITPQAAQAAASSKNNGSLLNQYRGSGSNFSGGSKGKP